MFYALLKPCSIICRNEDRGAFLSSKDGLKWDGNQSDIAQQCDEHAPLTPYNNKIIFQACRGVDCAFYTYDATSGKIDIFNDLQIDDKFEDRIIRSFPEYNIYLIEHGHRYRMSGEGEYFLTQNFSDRIKIDIPSNNFKLGKEPFINCFLANNFFIIADQDGLAGGHLFFQKINSGQ